MSYIRIVRSFVTSSGTSTNWTDLWGTRVSVCRGGLSYSNRPVLQVRSRKLRHMCLTRRQGSLRPRTSAIVITVVVVMQRRSTSICAGQACCKSVALKKPPVASSSKREEDPQYDRRYRESNDEEHARNCTFVRKETGGERISQSD